MKKRILVVEDDSAASDALRQILQHLGCEVIVAPTVASALHQLDCGMFGHVILDLMLPDGEGTEVLATIRAKKLDTHVIIATASSDDRLMSRVMSQKPGSVMKKPLYLPKLLEALDLRM